MTEPGPSNPDSRSRSPSRRTGTPAGYRNVRVLVPTDLHYRLISYSGISHMTVPEFALAWLARTTPLDPLTGQPLPVSNFAGAPGQDAEASPGPLPIPAAYGAAQGLSCGSRGDHGPGSVRSAGADAAPHLDRNDAPSWSGSSPTVTPTRAGFGQGHPEAGAGGQVDD